MASKILDLINQVHLHLKTGYKFNETSSIDILSMNGNHKNGQGWIGNTLEELNQNHSANGNISTETDNWFYSNE